MPAYHALAGQEEPVEVSHGDIGHVGHVFVVAQRGRLARAPVAVDRNSLLLVGSLVGSIVTSGDDGVVYRVVIVFTRGKAPARGYRQGKEHE